MIEFDLTDAFGGQDITVDSAALEIFVSSTGEAGAPYYLHRLTSSWQEGSVKWTNKPSYDSNYTDVVVADGYPDSWWEFDITDLIVGWEDDTYDNYGMVIISPEECRLPSIYSSDNSHADERPRLTVEYTVNSAVEEATWGQIKADL